MTINAVERLGARPDLGGFRQLDPGGERAGAGWPSWARWNAGIPQRYTIGVEEELMLLDPAHFSLVQSGEKVLRRLPDGLSAHVSPETHAAVIELATGIHADVAGAVTELAALRCQLARELRAMGLRAASAGIYPLAYSGEWTVSGSARYRMVANSLRALARRSPTLALHVHVGVPDAEDAIRLLNRLRSAVPLLLALSANSPFCQGRDSGFASMRTAIFGGFPRTGIARCFADYTDYVETVDALIASAALTDPSFLWWDVRLQPALGTVEVRVMDAQTCVADAAALIALVHSLAQLELEGEAVGPTAGPEVLAENRFLAARDGLNARLIDPLKRELVPARALLEKLLERCHAQADAVSSVELDRVARLAHSNGAERQRLWARQDGLVQLMSILTQRFAGPTDRSRPTSSPKAAHEAACRPHPDADRFGPPAEKTD
jgi:carboxylate-amine ligase